MYLTSKIQIFRIKKRDVYKHAFTVFTQVGVKQLTDFLCTVTAASDLVDCTLVNCEIELLPYNLCTYADQQRHDARCLKFCR